MSACQFVHSPESRDDTGRTKNLCLRCGREIWRHRPYYEWTGSPVICKAWPRLSDIKGWVAIFVGAVLFKRPLQRWLIAKFGPLGPRPKIGDGPGDKLAEMLHSVRAGNMGMMCQRRAEQMEQWGPDGCEEHREEIIAWLKESYDKTSRLDRSVCVIHAVRLGLWPRLKWSDPLGSLVDEAIRRAEKSRAQEAPDPALEKSVSVSD